MEIVKDLYTRLNSAKNFMEKYPEYNPQDNKVHVLFLSPCLNESGYYRMILPTFELNKTKTHSAIIGQIQKWDFNKQFDEYDTPIDLRLVKWADYVVLPVVFSDISYIIKTIREINSDIEFVMDLEKNYHQLPKYHPDKHKVSSGIVQIMENNLSLIDILSGPNDSLLKYYHDILHKEEKAYRLYFECYPNLISSLTFADIERIKQNKGEKIRLGLLTDSSRVEDLRTIEAELISLLRRNSGKIELVVFGLTAELAEREDIFKGAPIIYEKPVLFTQFHKKLNDLTIDIGLLPFFDNPFNSTGNALNRFLDFSAFMIPSVVPNISPFNKVIENGENGIIAETGRDWFNCIQELIDDAQARKEIGRNAFKTVWQNFSYNTKTIKRLENIFL